MHNSNKIIASDATIRFYVEKEIEKQGIFANLNHIDVSKVTNMSWLFSTFSSFNGDISEWDVSNVKDMSYMFSNSQFNSDISKWNVSNVETMYFMFFNSQFNQDISKWDVSNVKDMSYMFSRTKFNQDISAWNIENVDKIVGMVNFQYFNFHYLNKLIKKIKNKEVLLWFLYIPQTYQFTQSRFLHFIDFVNQNEELLYNCKSINHLQTSFPFLCCECFFIKNYLPLEEKIELIHNYFNINSYQDENFPRPLYFNLDFLLFHIIDDEKFKNYFEDHFLIYQNYFNILFQGLEDLLSVLQQPITNFPIINYLIDHLFQAEKNLILDNSQTYFANLEQNKTNFSDCFPYYSEKQKHELLKISNHNNQKFEENVLDI